MDAAQKDKRYYSNFPQEHTKKKRKSSSYATVAFHQRLTAMLVAFLVLFSRSNHSLVLFMAFV
jgi:steroid 5-alpha reductase family enzyme